MYSTEFKKPVDQSRTSELNKFLLRKDVFEKNPSAVEEYRQKYNIHLIHWIKLYRYTKGPQIFPRSYPGARDKNL